MRTVHNRAVLSQEPVRRREPSGEKAEATTGALCPTRVAIGLPEARSQSLVAPSAWPVRGARLCGPGLDRLVREPHGQAAALTQAGVIRGPVRDFVFLLRDVMAPILVQLEGQGGHPRSEAGRSPTSGRSRAPPAGSVHQGHPRLSEGQSAALAATATAACDFSVRNMRIPLWARAEKLICSGTKPGIRGMSVHWKEK